MTNLFAYGTLMCDHIMREVSGCRLLHAQPGTLKGYSRRCVKGEQYPAIVADEERCVEGVVYRNLPDVAWARLDRFEGEMYACQRVQIVLAGDAILVAAAYVLQPQFLDRLGRSDWDYDEFLHSGKASFRMHYKGYLSL
jgi:gamma-glutamylcyclotransferase (GGCT)/AIG2-like uncharacterized protein YtfP